MEKKKTAIIILNYNNSSDTINCIESVERYNTAPVKYIVVDNGSTKPEVIENIDKFLQDTFKDGYTRLSDTQTPTDRLPKASFVVSKTNDGYAKGNNKGLHFAYADDEIDKILILNSDILFVEDIIPKLSLYYDKINDVAILSPILYKKDMDGIDYNCARRHANICHVLYNYLFMYFDPFGLRRNWSRKQKILQDNTSLLQKDYFEIELPSGSCMFIDKNLFKSIGSFDPNTFLYFEEDILYKKIYSINKKNYLLTHSKCIHLGASTTNKEAGFYIIKSSIDSAVYYITHYLNKSYFLKVVLKMFRTCFLFIVKIQKALKNIFKFVKIKH